MQANTGGVAMSRTRLLEAGTQRPKTSEIPTVSDKAEKNDAVRITIALEPELFQIVTDESSRRKREHYGKGGDRSMSAVIRDALKAVYGGAR